jgi:formate dehydrogenase maturation protein FdhE
VRDSWDRRIKRAEQLAAEHESTRPLLAFYGQLLGLQRDAYNALRTAQLSGSLERDLDVVRPAASAILSAVSAIGPALLADEINEIVGAGDPALDRMLLEGWRTLAANQFLPKVILQPYAQRLAERSQRPLDRELYTTEYRCPFCAGPPQLSVLQGGGELEGGGRALLCATCLTSWPFRRVRCASCGEEDEHRLAYFHSPTFDHLRVDACETCHRYLKTVDLTRLGVAVPLVDEVAGAPLDVWARERGYEKIELNLVGL